MRFPLTVGNPVAVELLGLSHGKEPGRLAIILGLVHGFRLQCQRLGVRFIQAGIIIMAIDPQRDRHQPHVPFRQKFDHAYRTRTALRLLARRWRIGRLLVLTMSHLRPVLGDPQVHQEEHEQQWPNGPEAQNAI